MNAADKKIKKRLSVSLVAMVILLLCLGITTAALMLSVVRVDNNVFQTGSIEINLNDGETVVEMSEEFLEPGMTVKRDFFLENEGTWDVYYKFYFSNVTGELADILEITIKNDNTVLWSGLAANLTRESVQAVEDVLRVDEKRLLTMEFYLPKEAINTEQNRKLVFDLNVDAVQTKNNPDRLFD